MRHSLHIAINHLSMLRKDRTALAMMLVLPIILSYVTGMVFGGSSGNPQSYSVPIAFVDQDCGEVAQGIIAALSAHPYVPRVVTEAEARQLVSNREVTAAVFIPAGLEDSLRTGTPVAITMLRADYRESPRMVEQQLDGLLLQIRSAAAAANLATGAGIPWQQAYTYADNLWRPNPPVVVKTETVVTQAESGLPDGFNQASPGYVVMFGMMGAVVGGAVTLLSEREGGTLNRLVASPVCKGQLMFGKTLGIMLTAVLQMMILALCGQLLFNVSWGNSPVALIVLVVTLGWAATGIGMFFAAVCRTSSQANAVGLLVVLLFSMLGGAWWPMEVMPRHMQVVAKMVPSGWAMEGFTNIIMRGAGLGDVLLNAVVLLLFGALFLALGTKLFRYQ